MQKLRDQLAKARLKYRAAKHDRHLAHPKGARRDKLRRLQDFWEARKHRLKKRLKKAESKPAPQVCRPGEPNWNCCRSVTDFAIKTVDGAASVTSRKRTETYGNPGSEHHVSQTSSDAVDFGIAVAYSLARLIFRALTGSTAWGGDYSFFYFTFNGNRYRGQLIAGTHGTGPHLHFGCTRIG